MNRDGESDVTPIPTQFPYRNYTGAIVTLSMLIACLFAANLYTLDRLNTARQEERDLHSELGKQIQSVQAQNRQLILEYNELRDSNGRQITHLKADLDEAARQLGASTSQVLHKARTMVDALEMAQTHQTQALQNQIGQQSTALKGDVSSLKSQLGATQKSLDVLQQDFGDVQSRLGELATATDEQRHALAELTGSEYHPFTLIKNHPIRVGEIGLQLRNTNAHDRMFTLDLVANDQSIRNRNHSVDEPIIFYQGSARIPYEVVITAVGSNQVSGYLRTPKTTGSEAALTPRS